MAEFSPLKKSSKDKVMILKEIKELQPYISVHTMKLREGHENPKLEDKIVLNISEDTDRDTIPPVE